MDAGNKPSLLHMQLCSSHKPSIAELLKRHGTFISGITKEIICRTGTFLTAFITDGEKWGWRHRLGAAAVVTALVCSPGCLGVNAASAAAALHQRRWGTVPIWNILRLLKIKVQTAAVVWVAISLHPVMVKVFLGFIKPFEVENTICYTQL